jgi:hypothetical protein
MTRIHIICEGQTEETFVNNLLVPHFAPRSIMLHPSLIGKPGHKGGFVNFNRLFIDVQNRLLYDKTAWCTTFFDYYGLPNDFPGKQKADKGATTKEKSLLLLDGLITALGEKLDAESLCRFIPYVQMHEFEGLLFSDPVKFAIGIGCPKIKNQLQKVRNAFADPEEINDNPTTAPSKRIQAVCQDYEKPIHGTLAALEIGLDIIRQECHLFDDWLRRLEALVSTEIVPGLH